MNGTQLNILELFNLEADIDITVFFIYVDHRYDIFYFYKYCNLDV